mgnify:CR=1 FL=1
MNRTIVAISTAPGTGGIGIVRMSGKDCFDILSKIFIPMSENSEIKGYSIKYGKNIKYYIWRKSKCRINSRN